MNLLSNLFKRSSLRSSLQLAILLVVSAGSVNAQHYYRSQARPLAEIKQTFPYDIELLARAGSGDTLVTTSTEVLGQHRGERPVVMLFWLTTCGPCRLELADLEQRMARWQQAYDFAFVPISIDFPKRRGAFHERAAAYPWTSYLDVNREFPLVMPGKLNGVPQLFVFDDEGEQVFYRRKYRTGDLEALEEVLGRL